MNENRKKIGITVTLVVLAAVAVTGILVFAQSSGANAGAAASNGSSTTFFAKVARNLGIDEAKLTAAMNAARVEAIDEAQAAGRITEEQATAMKERLAAETAMDQLVAEGIASGKITHEQARLLGGRGMGGPMMVRRGAVSGRGFDEVGRDGAECEGNARAGRR